MKDLGQKRTIFEIFNVCVSNAITAQVASGEKNVQIDTEAKVFARAVKNKPAREVPR
jgi:hypothetical protein